MAYLLYLRIRIALFVVSSFRIGGYQRAIVGKCTILAPTKQLDIILKGIEYLRQLDPRMFQQLTVDHRYLFWYRAKEFVGCRNIYTITDNFLRWGNEGVATFVAHAVLDFNFRYVGSCQPVENSTPPVAARQEVRQKIFEFVKSHSFSPELVKQYRELADR